jgi:PfaD family protein
VLALRSELAVRFPAAAAVAVGAAGGLGTPAALAAAFAMGADYVVTGSINQACVEAGTSDAAKRMLAASEPGDTAMAPAPDMFELGARVQVLKRGTLYALRAQRLYDLWRDHRSLDALPDETVRQLEAQVFRQPLAALWPQVQAFWSERDPERLRAADRDSSLKLALLFRWYLGLSSRWALGGDATRAADFQIWCGPSMAAFNLWARSTPFERPEGRRVVAVAEALMDGCARLLAEVGSARGQAPAAAPAPVPADDEHPSVRDWLIAAVASALGVPEEDVDPRDPFTSYGMDSVQAMLLLKRLERRIGRPLSPTMVFNYPSIDALSARLSAEAVCG